MKLLFTILSGLSAIKFRKSLIIVNHFSDIFEFSTMSIKKRIVNFFDKLVVMLRAGDDNRDSKPIYNYLHLFLHFSRSRDLIMFI